MTLLGNCLPRASRLMSFALGGGVTLGYTNGRRIALNSEICSTFLVSGYDAVKMGSKIAAR